MTMPTDSNYYQSQGEALDRIRPALGWLELAEAGRYQEALACIEGHLRTAPDDVQALNDAGAILHCLGRSDEAINHLVQARDLSCSRKAGSRSAGADAEIVWNLVEAYLADGRANEAMQLFDDMQRLGILNVDVLNRTANVFLNQENYADAIETLLRSLRLAPEQEILRPMIEVIRSKRAKIAFFCGSADQMQSLADIYEFAERRFPVQRFDCPERLTAEGLFEGQNTDEAYELMKSSDLCWFEGCTDAAVQASKQPKVCKNIVRLRGFDHDDNWASQILWENIDVIMTDGNPLVKDALLQKVPDIKNRTWLVTIPNGVDLDKFKFIDRGRGKNLACIGHLSMRKNPMLLLQCMQKLHYIDPEHKLFFAGTFQNPMVEQYVRHMAQALKLTEVVFFDGWHEDINSWLKDKHYIVSGSIAESQGMGLLEGMACGLKPVIHNFPGASAILPSEFLFNISEEFCGQILCDTYEPQRYRRFVEENYPLKNRLSKVNDILTQLEAESMSRHSRSGTRVITYESQT